MLAPRQEFQAAGSRALVLLGAVCVLSGLVAWGVYEHAPVSTTRAHALALYVLPAGLRPVGAPGPQTAPVAPPSVMMPSSSPGATMPMPAAPATPEVAPFVMNPTPLHAMPQAPPGQPFMERAPQTMPQAMEPSVTGTFMGPLQLFFLGLAAGGAVGATVTKKLMNNFMQKSRASLNNDAQDAPELGTLPRRAGAPTMAASGADEMLDEFFINFPIIFTGILVAFFIVEYLKQADWVDSDNEALASLPISWEFIAIPVLAIGIAGAGKLGILGSASGVLAKVILDVWNAFAGIFLPGALLKY